MLLRIANREDLDQTASGQCLRIANREDLDQTASAQGLCCLSRRFLQATPVRNFRTPTCTIVLNSKLEVKYFDIYPEYLSRDMRFPTMWYVGPIKPQISLRIRAV